jgi:hypothetical protein
MTYKEKFEALKKQTEDAGMKVKVNEAKKELTVVQVKKGGKK